MPPPGVWPLARRSATALQRFAEERRHRFVVVPVDANAERRALLLAIGQAFAFPAWYGANLDALYDCLTDLPEQGDAPGCVALIKSPSESLPEGRSEGPSARHRQQPVLDVLAEAAQYLARHGYELRVFVAPDARGSG